MNWSNRVPRGLAWACLLVPWLHPLAAGPSTSVEPWLLAALCAVVLFAAGPVARPRTGVLLLLGLLAAWPLARSGAKLDTLAAAGGCAIAALCACAAARPRATDDLPLAPAWLAAALASTAIALVQYFGWAEAFWPWVTQARVGEAYANLRQRNQLASLLVIGLAAALWFVRTRGPHRAWTAGAVLLAVGNAATTSRTGLLQLGALAVLAVAWPGDHRRAALRLTLAALASYVAGAVLLPMVLQWLGHEAPFLWQRVGDAPACSSRTVLWSNVATLIAQRPWLGWGWGELDHAHFTNLYEGARFCDILDNAHNLPLHLAVELGLPVAVLACGAALWGVVRARPWREADPARQLAWSVLAVLAIHSLLEYPLWYGPFQIALGLALGLLWPAPEVPPRATALRWVLPLLAVPLLAYAAWDYRRVSQVYLPVDQRAERYRDDVLDHVRSSWLFRSQAAFAELTLSTLERSNAAWTLASAEALLHYSPEPRVIEKAIEAATMLGRDDVALWYLIRYRAAFPDAYAAWSRRLRAT